MKVLLDVDHSFAWAHGGVQTIAENLLRLLPQFGVEVEPLRWWDAKQNGDLLHTFYMPRGVHLLAKKKGMKIVCNVFLDYLASNGHLELTAKRLFIPAFKKVFRNYARELGWYFGQIADAVIFPSQYEMILGKRLFGVSREKSHVILHGVSQNCLDQGQSIERGDFLLSLGTIHKRKNSVLLAELARELRIPMVFAGRPYAEDVYFNEFRSLVDGGHVIYKGFVDEETKLELLRRAKGFISLSLIESGCIAVLEALACGCPVLLPSLPWARSIYKDYATFGYIKNKKKLKRQIDAFYRQPGGNLKPFPILSWKDVVAAYLSVYEIALSFKNGAAR